MKGKKWLSLIVVLSMVVSFLPLAAAATNYSDTQEHWAKAEIAKWSDLGILQGSGNLFRPSAPITRGEMAIILDCVMKYQDKAPNFFVDLDQSWYTDAVLKANAAGIIQGDGKTVRPLDKITREEAAVMFGRALGLDEVSGATSFADNASISTWARGYINAMADEGLVGGVGGNQFAPKAYITRGEVVKMLDNGVKGFYTTAATQSGTVNGTAIVNADGATLKNMTINGDLIIAEGVGDGEVTLDSVKVTGQTIVRGGGENSVIVTGNSSLGKVVVSKKSDGTVSVKVTGNAKVDVVVAENGSINVSGTVSRLDIKGDVDVSLVNAKVATVNVESAATVAVDKASVVTTVSVDAPKANLSVSGTVSTVTASAKATNANISTTSTAKITSVVAQGQGTTISGSGTITTVKAEANNVAVSTPNTKVEAAKGTTGVTAGGTTVSSGSSSTTNNTGTGTITPPSGGGGGGGGGSTTVRVGSLSVAVPTADGTGTETDATNIGKYTVGAVTGNYPNLTTKITATKALVDVTSANEQQGTAKWIGILITTDREVNTLAVKTGSTFTNLTDADVIEAQAAGAKDSKTFVWWLKSEEMTSAKIISIKVQGQGDTTAVKLAVNFTPHVAATPPTLAKGSPVTISPRNGDGWTQQPVANDATIKRGTQQPNQIYVQMSEAVTVVNGDKGTIWVTTTSNGTTYAEYGTFFASAEQLTITPRTGQPAPVDGTFTFKIEEGTLKNSATGDLNDDITFTLTFDGTAPELTDADFALVNGKYVLTVKACDEISGLASLEVDHSLDGILPEFTLDTRPLVELEETDLPTELRDYKGTKYTYANDVWTVTFNEFATQQIINNATITFYFAIKDVAGNQFGDMYDVTDDMIRNFDVLVPDTEAPTLGAVTFERNDEGNYVLTVNASDVGSGLASLEVDHSLDGILPEFTLDTRPLVELEETDLPTELRDYKGTKYTYANDVWTVTFNEFATQQIIKNANGSITFYFVIKDVAGNQFGDMYNVTKDMTREFDVETAPVVTIADRDNDALATYKFIKEGMTYSGVQARVYMTTEEKAKILDGDKVNIRLYSGGDLLGESITAESKSLASDIFKNTYAEQENYASTLFYVGETPYPSSSWETAITQMSQSKKPDKMVVEYIRNGVVISATTKESDSLVNDSFTDGTSSKAVSWDSLFETPSLVGAALTADDETGNLILTVQTTDTDNNWASLEVDHSLEGILSEFTLTTERVELGDDAGDFKGVVSDFDAGTWTVNFNAYASNLIRANANGKMTFYFVIRDEEGNQFGDMFNVTGEMTKELDVPPLALKHRISLGPVEGDEAPASGSAAHNIAFALKNGSISVDGNVVYVSGIIEAEYDPWNPFNPTDVAYWLNIRLSFPNGTENGTYAFQYGENKRLASISRNEGSTGVRIILSVDDAKKDGFETSGDYTGMMKLAFDWNNDGNYDDEVFYVDMSGVETGIPADLVD